MITVTTGKILFTNKSSSISAFICSQEKQVPLYTLRKEPNLIEGISFIDGGSWNTARKGVDFKDGGFWATNNIEFDRNKEFVMRLLLTHNTPSNKISSVGYYLIRNGAAISAIDMKKCFVEKGESRKDRLVVEEEKQSIIIGGIDQITMEAADKLYGVKTRPFDKSINLTSMRNRLIKYDIMEKAKNPIPQIERKEINTISGIKVVNRRKKKRVRYLKFN